MGGGGGYCLSMKGEVIFCNLEDFCFFLVFFVAKNEKITQIIYKLFIFLVDLTRKNVYYCIFEWKYDFEIKYVISRIMR